MTVLLLASASTKAVAAATFLVLLLAGSLLHKRLEARARAEEAEALLDEEFARLERLESRQGNER